MNGNLAYKCVEKTPERKKYLPVMSFELTKARFEGRGAIHLATLPVTEKDDDFITGNFLVLELQIFGCPHIMSIDGSVSMLSKI